MIGRSGHWRCTRCRQVFGPWCQQVPGGGLWKWDGKVWSHHCPDQEIGGGAHPAEPLTYEVRGSRYVLVPEASR